MKTNKLLLALCLITLLGIVGLVSNSYAEISYDFNSGSSDFLSNFQQNTVSSQSFVYYTNGGLSDSGSVRGGGAYDDACLFKTPLSTVSGTDVILSLYFKTQALVADGDIAGVGISSSLTANWSDQATASIRVRGGGNLVGNSSIEGIRGAGENYANGTDIAKLLGNEWYQLVVDFHDYGNGWRATGNLFDYGTSGSANPSSAGSFSNFVLGDLGTTNSVYVGIYGGTAGGNAQLAQRLDNFTATTAVPEPSTYFLFGIGALTLIITLKRRIS